jgi:predicted glycoside hydrolase/deacetylase ChbG (UPF0249 family)
MTSTNRLLGYPDDARLLILNADDLGICQAANDGTLQAIKQGVVRSTSLMMPWPAAAHAIRLLKDNPDIPFGVHLSIVNDMPDYRWRPLAPAESVPSLLDESGYFYSIARMSEILSQAKLDELEVEFRAQIEAALATGLKPTHLDWHCLHSGGRADIFDMTFGLAREYGLALRVADKASIAQVQSQGLPTDEHDLMDSYDVDTANKAAIYTQMLRELPQGLSEWAVHPALNTPEMQTIEPDSWQVRYTDYQFLMSTHAREVIQQEGIILLDYRPLQQVWQSR